MLHDKNIETIIGDNFGPNVIDTLNEKNITHKETGNIGVSSTIID